MVRFSVRGSESDGRRRWGTVVEEREREMSMVEDSSCQRKCYLVIEDLRVLEMGSSSLRDLVKNC